MARLIKFVSFFALLLGSAFACSQAVPTAPSIDPCASNIAKSSAPVNITTATTTQLVALASGQAIYVCGFYLSMVATIAPNVVTFEYGTGSNCGTGTTTLTGAMSSGILAAGATPLNYGGGSSTVFKTAAGNALCILSTVGTGPSISGVVTYIQQ